MENKITNPITTMSRERLEQLADENTICKVSWDERIEMSRAMLEVMDANPPPVWGQARFKGGDWASCSVEHAAMVMANPEEWGDYECRYLYTTPPAMPYGWAKRFVVKHAEWTDEQCIEFLSIAFRHAEIKGYLELDDIRLAMKIVNPGGEIEE